MSLLHKLFRRHWQHRSATRRQKAVTDGKVSQEHCIELALHDSSPSVRESAVQQIDSIDVLVELGDQAPTLHPCLAVRLKQLLPDYAPSDETQPDHLDRAMRLLDDAPVYKALAESAEAVCVRIAALRHVEDPAILRTSALSDKAVEVRKAAVDCIDSPVLLAEIAKSSKGRDKTIARQADLRLADMRERAHRQERRARLLAELDALDQEARPLDERIWQRSQDDWQALAQGATPAEQARFDALLKRLSAKLQEQKRRQEADRAARKERSALIEQLRQLADSVVDADAGQVAAALGLLRTGWEQAAPMQDPWSEHRLHEEWTDLLHDLEGRLKQRMRYAGEEQAIAALAADLDKQLQAGDLSTKQIERAERRLKELAKAGTDEPSLAKALQRPKQLIELMRQQFTDQEARRHSLQATLEQQIDAMEGALAQQALERATRAHRAAINALRELGKPAPPAVRKLETRLRRSEPELRELQAWRNWGNDQARAELVAEAKALIDADISLERRAQALQDLRKRWKALGGAGRKVQQSWEVFDAACTAAHAPIKQQRAQEAATRAQNLAQREAVCAELEALTEQTNWDDPDWRAVDRQLQTLRRRWHDSGSVAKKAWGKVRERYDRALEALDQHLIKERRHNFLHRQALVQAAEALAAHEDVRQAVAEARNLRDAWQVTVTSKPGEERRLWQAFNSALDQAFARDRAAREHFKADLDAHRRQAEDLCHQLEQLPAQGGETPRQQQARLAQAEAQFAALGPLPKASRHALQRRFEQAVEQLRQHLANAEREQAHLALRQLAELHAVCEAAEALVQGATPAEPGQIDALRERWDIAPKPQTLNAVVERLSERFEDAIAIADTSGDVAKLGDLERNARHREALCVDLEILLGIASPVEAGALRLQRQVELLEDAMQGGDQDQAERIRQLQLDYLAAGPVPADRQPALHTRFSRVFK